MPPDLFGNIAASSAWMLFCMAPREIEIVQSTNAPVVPSAPTDPPSEAIRKAGLQSATTKPSHHVIALRSCLSSTSACAIHAPLCLLVKRLVPIGTSESGPFYHPPRTPSILLAESHATAARPSRGPRCAPGGADSSPPSGARHARGPGPSQRRAHGD